MDITFALNHIGYVFCFWGVWKSLDLVWNLLRVEGFINNLLDRQSDVERQVAGKLAFYNKVREKDEVDTRKLLKEMSASISELKKKLTPEMDQNLRSTVYGLHERLKLATDGLKFDHELPKEMEKLRKKIHELSKAVGEPTPCVLPINPEVQPSKIATPAKRARKRTSQKALLTGGVSVNRKPHIQEAKSETLKYSPPQILLQNIKDEEAAMLLGMPPKKQPKMAAKKS